MEVRKDGRWREKTSGESEERMIMDDVADGARRNGINADGGCGGLNVCM